MSAASTSSTTTTIRSQNPFEAARLALIQKLLRLQVPKALSSYPIPSDFVELANHVREASAIFDEWIETIGFQVEQNAPCNVDQRAFCGAYTGAIEGNATFEIEEVGEAIREGREAA